MRMHLGIRGKIAAVILICMIPVLILGGLLFQSRNQGRLEIVQRGHRDLARAMAADRWDALARAQADALGSPELFRRFLDEEWNHFRFPDPMDQPSALLHHFVWLRHAGFAAVDCVWIEAGHAVFGGFKQAGGPAPPPPADS